MVFSKSRVPVLFQLESMDSGPVSLAMVFAFHNVRVSVDQLRIECAVTRQGMKASQLLRVARHYGFDAKGWSKSAKQLENLSLPVILHWEFSHFVVLIKLTAEKAFIHDPARGELVITRQAFDLAYTGVVLTLAPTSALAARPTSHYSSFLAIIRARVESVRAALILLVFVSVLIGIITVVSPIFTKIFVDGILVKRQEWVGPLFVMMLIATLVQSYLLLMNRAMIGRLKRRMTITTSASFFWHILNLPFKFFTQRSHGELVQRIEANETVAVAIANDLTVVILEIFTACLLAAMLLIYEPRLGAVAVGGALALMGYMLAIQPKLSVLAQKMILHQGRLVAWTASVIYGIETVKASGIENHAFQRWSGIHANVLVSVSEFLRRSMWLTQAPNLIYGMVQVLVLGLGGWMVALGELTIGDLLALELLVSAFFNPIQKIIALGAKLSVLRASVWRIQDALSYKEKTITSNAETTDQVTASGEVNIENLSFGYDPFVDDIIDDLNLHLRSGQRIAIMGRSGCGKSTLARLLVGLLEPKAGQVTLGGVNIQSMSGYQKSDYIGYVDQDIFLFEGTVRQNLTMWDPFVADDILIQALRDAEILDDVMNRPQQLDAIVLEGGRNFSGGQRQRLDIARALVRQPRLLVLDESTQALDGSTERKILDNLQRRGCTLIWITHRFPPSEMVDEVYWMAHGQCVPCQGVSYA